MLRPARRSAHARPWLAEARAIAILAGPLIVTQLAQMAVMTTDVILLGRFSRTALAAAAIGNTLFYCAWLIGGGPALAVAPMIAQLLGLDPEDKEGVRACARMGLWASLTISIPMVVVLWQAQWILLALHQDPILAENAGKFLRMVSLELPFALGFQVVRGFTTAVGRPRAGMWVMAATIGFNGLVGWTLIFGHFGAPRLGIVGSGLATALSGLFSFSALVIVVQTDKVMRGYRLFQHFGQRASDKLAEVFRLGLPIGLTLIFEAMLFNVMTLVMGTFGVVSLAAHQIALNVASITFMVPLGLGMASTVRVGLAAGAGDDHGVRRAGLTAMAMGVGFITLCGAAMALFGRPIAQLYVGGRASQDLAVIAMAALFLKVAAAFQVFDALQVVAAQSLRGLKDAHAPMFIAGGAYWLAGAPACLLLAYPFGLAGFGVWIGLAIGLAVAAIALFTRFALLTRAKGAL
ncbi:MAG TPA: MATE family efflux transporter [Caulobacteraceae bacterium]|jgi:MATE family multidrug resistance protein